MTAHPAETGKSSATAAQVARTTGLLLWMLLLTGLACGPASAQVGGIVVAPTRVVLESGERSAQVYVANRSDTPATIRITLVNRHMREDGSMEPTEAARPGERFADDLLRHAPRRVQLGAGQGQNVRVLARPPGGQAAEYRSHLLFQVEPPAKREGGRESGEGVSITLTPVYGVSIPVIVRTGELPVSTSIGTPQVLEPAGPGKPPRVTFDLQRDGDASVYGDLRIFHRPRGYGTESLVGKAGGVAVYTPLDSRRVTVPLGHLEGRTLPPGRLRIQYVDADDTDRVLAEAVADIP